MADPQIIANIKSGLSVNDSREKIIETLKIQGYTDADIQAAFSEIESTQVQAPSEVSSPVPVASPAPVVSLVSNAPQPAALSGSVAVTAQTVPVTPPVSSAPSGTGVGKLFIVLVSAIVVVGAGVGYAYYANIGPFAVQQYTNDNLLSGILEKSSNIQSASYKVSASLAVHPRDKDATPFVIPGQDPDVEVKYKADRDAISFISSLVSSLSYTSLSNGFGDMPALPATASLANRVYPKTKSDIEKALKNSSMFYYSKAPEYSYVQTDSGHNFNIILDLQTDEAAAQVKKSTYYSATATPISGRRVIFTKDSRYLNIPYQFPKPFLMSLADSLKTLSSDVSGSLEIGATTNFKDASSTDWKANLNGTGNFGDLSYSVDVDAMHKGLDYYFKINKMPAILSFVSLYKGQWIKVSPSATSTATSSRFSLGSMYASSLSKQESSYKEKRQEYAQELRDMVALAQSQKVVLIKGNPQEETVDGRHLIRYDLDIQKDAILPFYQALISQPEKFKDLSLTQDKELVAYLQGDGFAQTFDYFKKNVTITLWADKDGYPAIVQYGMRVVPPDTATQLKDKQIDITLKLMLDDINKDTRIDAPSDAKTIEEVEQAVKNNQ